MSVNLSYRLSQEHNAQTLLWDSCGLIVAGIRKTAGVVGRLVAIVTHFLPHLLFALAIVAKALGLVVVVATVVAAVACVPLQFWGGLLIIGAFGWATFPRAKVR